MSEEALRIKKKEEEVRALEEKKRRKQERKKRKLELKEARSKLKAQKELTVSSEAQSFDQEPTSAETLTTEGDGGQKDKIPSDTAADDGANQTSQKEDEDALDDYSIVVDDDDVNVSSDVLEKKVEQEEITNGEGLKSEEKNKNETNEAPEKDKEAASDSELVDAKFAVFVLYLQFMT